MNNDHEIRRDAIINSASEQLRGLLETHFKDITKAAEESFVGDERETEPVAKVGVTVSFGALAAATKVSVKCSWSVKHADESEEEIDPLQSKLGLPEDRPSAKVRALAAEIENAPPAVKAAAKDLVANLRKHNATLTMKNWRQRSYGQVTTKGIP